jgi:hypothetical protein
VQLWTRVSRDALRSTTRHPPQTPPRCRCCDTCSGVAIVRPEKICRPQRRRQIGPAPRLPPNIPVLDFQLQRRSCENSRPVGAGPGAERTGGSDFARPSSAVPPAHPAGTCTRLKGALQLTLSSPAAHCVAPFQALPSHVCRPGLPARLRDGRSVCARAACSFAPPSPPPSLAPRLTALATSQPFPPRLDSGAARQGAERRAATVLCGAVVAEAR